jgi:hypothetical protein
MHSHAGVARWLKFREPLRIEPADCQKAFLNGGRLRIGTHVVDAKLNRMTSHSVRISGALDDNHKCESGSLSYGNRVLGEQVATSILEVELFDEVATVFENTGKMRTSTNLLADVKDRSLVDSVYGTYVWNSTAARCPDSLSQVYRGTMKVFVNSTGRGLEGALAVLVEKDRVAGLEIGSPFVLCALSAWRTHIADIILIVHGDNVTSLASAFDPSTVSEFTRVESTMSFWHIT